MHFVEGGTVMTEDEVYLEKLGYKLVECTYCKEVYVPVLISGYNCYVVYACKECKSTKDHEAMIAEIKELGYPFLGVMIFILIMVGIGLVISGVPKP